MATEFIPNVGNIELPDGLSDQEREEAVNSHPRVQAYLKNQGKENLAQKADQLLTNIFGPMNNYMKNNSFLQASDNFSHQIGKGIPIAGHFLPDTDEQKKFAEDHPIASAIAHGIGGAVALGPASEAIALKSLEPAARTVNFGEQTGAKTFEGIMQSPSAYQKLSPGVKNAVGQAGLFGGTTAADDLVQGKSLEDTGKETVLSAVGGAIGGPVASKIASPGINVPDWLAKAVTGLGGAVTGLHYGGPMEAILGLLGGRSHGAPELLQKLLGNRIVKNPEDQAIMNVLASEGAKSSVAPVNGPMVPNGD